MKFNLLAFAFILLFSLNLFAQSPIKVTVVGIVDGDTITALDREKRQATFRIVGIDAPEKEQIYGDIAQQRLAALVLNKNVTVAYLTMGNQRVGRVFLNDKDIALEILRAGNAWYFSKDENLLKPKEASSYALLESEARKIKTGLWQSDSPESPWDFRERILAESRRQIPLSFSSVKGINGKVTEVISGISFAVIKSDNSRMVVCINNLEVPEPGQPLSDVAEQHLRDLLINKIVVINIKGFTEDDGCLSADAYLNNINVNLQMVRDGVAWANKDYYYPEGYYTYEQAENAARSERRGIWQNDAPIAPWIYREQYNNGQTLIRSSSGGGGASSSSGAGRTVKVRGYTRRDGTYVRPYTRSAPNTRSGGGRRN